MAKSKITKSILKTVAAGFACVMCGAFFPANAMADALENYSNGNFVEVNRISVDTGNKAENQQSMTVKKGEVVVIPAATYSYKATDGSQGSITIGENDDEQKIETSIVVTEKTTGDVVDSTGGKFTASAVDTYVVTYKVVHDGVEYSYDLMVTAQATTASFDFESNVETVIPQVYDISIANKKDIVLPLPTVMGEGEETLLKNTQLNNYITGTAVAGVTGDVYVKLSLTNGGEGVALGTKEVEGKEVYYISGETLSKLDDGKDTYTYDGKTFKIVYAFYQKVNGADVFVASTSKSFTVKEKYYFKDGQKKENGYELDAAISTFPDSATVGVEKTLPGVTCTTKSTNSPAVEGIETSYTIKVLKMNENGKYVENEESYTLDGNKFTAKEEGSYKFIYSVNDFYGFGENIEEDKLTRTITNVKDSKSASVFIYDAAKGYDEENNTYASAENMLKTKGVNRNIIMYAVGGTDNMVAKDQLTLRREIKNYSGITEYVIEDYNEYNLIFAATEGATIVDTYHNVIDDNFALRSQLELAGIVTDKLAAGYDSEKIIEYMQKYYLIVTDDADKDGVAGYAYITPAESRNGTFKNQSYTFYYYAKDEKNPETSVKKDIEFIEDYNDEAVPTLTFSSDLQASYLATETFKFNVVSATDNQDSRLKAITAYRFLGEDKQPIASTTTTDTIKYYAGRIGKVDASKWYNKSYTLVEEEGWYIDEAASEYTVDLKQKPKGATYVEIFAYAIDDNGNVGFFNKMVSIADATDLDVPVLKSITKAPTASDVFTAPKEIELPTLTFTDAKVNYVKGKVAVYRIIRDEQTKEEIGRNIVTSYDMVSTRDSYRGTFTVSGGYFRASVSGEYQAAITVVDNAGHSVTSFFTYNVKSGAGEVLKPTIDNIPTAEEKVAPGEMVYLTPPSISMTREEGFGYIGLEEDDDANTSTWYNVEAISATDNDYEITNNNLYFSAGTEGTYKLKYTAYLIKYATSAVKAAVSGEESLQINANGQLIYTDAAGATHLVYLDEEGKLTADDFTGESLPQFVKDNVEGEAIESDSVITITVTSASLEINDSEMNLHYDVKTEFDVGDDSYIEVIKPRVKAIGTADVDDENTTVTITRNSTNLATNIKLNEWADTDDISLKDYFNVDAANGKIYLKFIKDGKYTITYNLKSTVGTTDTYSVTLSAGDTTPPELEIKDEIVKENYKVGDSLHIAFSHATVEDVLHVKDGSQSVESLLESLEVKIKYEDNAYETLTDEAAASDEHFEYNYKLEQKGTYTLSITIQDAAGNPTTKTISFEVGTEEGSSVDAGEVMGGVLIGLSVALLAGVVIYFAVSKKKLDKKEKGYKLDRSKSRRR